MAKKRTKQAKLKAQQSRQLQVRADSSGNLIVNSPSGNAAESAIKTAPIKPPTDLLSYDVRLIKKDLRKTVLVTLLIVVLLVALAWYL